MGGVERRWERGIVVMMRWRGRCRWVRVHDHFPDWRGGRDFHFSWYGRRYADVRMVYRLRRNSAIVEWWVGLMERGVRAHGSQTRVAQAWMLGHHLSWRRSPDWSVLRRRQSHWSLYEGWRVRVPMVGRHRDKRVLRFLLK